MLWIIEHVPNPSALVKIPVVHEDIPWGRHVFTKGKEDPYKIEPRFSLESNGRGIFEPLYGNSLLHFLPSPRVPSPESPSPSFF
jgi:hypothetical protein